MVVPDVPNAWLSWAAIVASAAGVASAVATAVLAYFAKDGLRQVRAAVEQLEVAKKDVRLRSEREARAAAFEQCERMRTTIIPTHAAFMDRIGKSSVPAFLTQNEVLSFNTDDTELVRRARDWVAALPLDLANDSILFLNTLETWAMTFTSGIADASVAYKPAADIFCRYVVQHYPTLMFLRGTRGADLFSNTEALYRDWSGRQTARNLERQEKILADQLAQIRKAPKPPDHPKPIGTDI